MLSTLRSAGLACLLSLAVEQLEDTLHVHEHRYGTWCGSSFVGSLRHFGQAVAATAFAH